MFSVAPHPFDSEKASRAFVFLEKQLPGCGFKYRLSLAAA
jgi:hypothetical protein